jgi:predicted lysophospholipase L1 biosynthesis ABC-type transport system permease subunit
MALGAHAGHVARRVTTDVFAMVIAGAASGLALGFASARYLESLLYQVKPTDPSMLALPSLTILAAALLAALVHRSESALHYLRTAIIVGAWRELPLRLVWTTCSGPNCSSS